MSKERKIRRFSTAEIKARQQQLIFASVAIIALLTAVLPAVFNNHDKIIRSGTAQSSEYQDANPGIIAEINNFIDAFLPEKANP